MANTKRITITADATLSVNGNSNQIFDFGQVRSQLSTAEADEFWNNVKSDGGDIRVYYNDGSTQTRVAVDLRDFDATAETGHMVFDSSDHAASTATDWDIEFGDGTLTQPTVTDTYGRNSVYSQAGEDYEAVFALEEDPTGTAPQYVDRTGNGYDGTANAMEAGDQVAAIFGNGANFDGGGEYISLASNITFDGAMSLMTWINASGTRHYFSGDLSSTDVWWQFWVDTDRGCAVELNNNTTVSWTSTPTADTDTYIAFTSDTSDDWRNYIDATQIGTAQNNTAAGTVGGIGRGRSDGASDTNGILDEFRVANFTASANWITEEYNNQSNQSGFWSVSDVSDISSSTNFDGEVSIGHTLGLSPSASAAVTGGVTNAQTMGMSDQGGATTLASLEQAISLALQTSGAISFEGSITIDVTYGQGSSATAQTSAELSGAENVTLFHSYAMSTSAQSSAAGATTIDLSYGQSATGAVSINNFDASVALGDITYQTSITGTAQTVASATQSIQYALDSIAAAAVSSNTSIAYINDISASATVITVDVTLADGRTLTIKMQNRTHSIDSENRTLTIDP